MNYNSRTKNVKYSIDVKRRVNNINIQFVFRNN